MKKRSLFLYSFAALSISLSAQVDLRMTDRMRLNGVSPALPAQSAGEAAGRRAAARQAAVEMIIRYSDPAVLDAIEALGAEVTSTVGSRTAIVSCSATLAEQVAAIDGVTGARLSEKVEPVNMVARAASNVDKVHSGDELSQPFDGSGVVVGLYDIGIDPNHINFLDDNGITRVQKLWHYPTESSAFDYYESPAKVSVFEYDYYDTHGTHVMGILGGSFVNDPAHDYRGMAPGADLAVTCGLGYNAQILDGLEKISKYAKEQGKPCVINVSFGDNLGPHDGTDEFTEAIGDIALKYGSIICLAGGNERDENIAIIKECTDESPEVRTVLLPGLNEMDATFQTFGTIEIYGQDNTPFEVYVDIISRTKPGEPVYTYEIPYNKDGYLAQGSMIDNYVAVTSRTEKIDAGTPFQDYYADSFIGGRREVDPFNKRYHCKLNAYLVARTSANAARYFTVLRIKPQQGKKVFVYCDGAYMSFGNKNMRGFDVPDGNGTNSNMGSGPNTIAAGSYVTANIEGSPYTYGTVGELSWFSSYGETPDGRFIPEVCAPGQVIISSRNRYYGNGGVAVQNYPIHYTYVNPKTNKTYHWTSCAGTSQASPHVAGVVALWLSANPYLTLDDIREIIANTSKAPTSDQPGWGHGIIDAYAGIKAALGDYDAMAAVKADNDDVLVRMNGRICEAFVAGSSAVAVNVYDLAGNLVLNHSEEGDTANASLAALPSGIYMVQVAAGKAVKTVKVAI